MYQLFKPNKNGVDYCVGDLHGNYTALFRLLEQVKFDKTKDRLFALGDLTDRGLDSPKVLELLKNDWFFTIRGNHEDIIIKHGLKKYTDCYGDENKEGNEWFFEQTIEHRTAIIKAFKALPYAIQVGKVGLVHAYPLDDWRETLLSIKNRIKKDIGNIIWNRNPAKSVLKGGRIQPITNIDTVIVGHHIFKDPEKHANVIFLDTGYFKGGSLSLINLSTLQVVARVFNKDYKNEHD